MFYICTWHKSRAEGSEKRNKKNKKRRFVVYTKNKLVQE